MNNLKYYARNTVKFTKQLMINNNKSLTNIIRYRSKINSISQTAKRNVFSDIKTHTRFRKDGTAGSDKSLLATINVIK